MRTIKIQRKDGRVQKYRVSDIDNYERVKRGVYKRVKRVFAPTKKEKYTTKIDNTKRITLKQNKRMTLKQFFDNRKKYERDFTYQAEKNKSRGKKIKLGYVRATIQIKTVSGKKIKERVAGSYQKASNTNLSLKDLNRRLRKIRNNESPPMINGEMQEVEEIKIISIEYVRKG